LQSTKKKIKVQNRKLILRRSPYYNESTTMQAADGAPKAALVDDAAAKGAGVGEQCE